MIKQHGMFKNYSWQSCRAAGSSQIVLAVVAAALIIQGTAHTLCPNPLGLTGVMIASAGCAIFGVAGIVQSILVKDGIPYVRPWRGPALMRVLEGRDRTVAACWLVLTVLGLLGVLLGFVLVPLSFVQQVT